MKVIKFLNSANLLTGLLFCLLFLPHISYSQALSGTYTIGGTSPDYKTFTAAVTDLNKNGVSGAVVFKVRSGVYNEQIKLDTISGSSKTNYIRFQSESGKPSDVILKHTHTNWSTNANYTVFINGADNLAFKNMTIEAVKDLTINGDYNRVIYVTNNSDNLLFENNIIKSWYVTSNYFKYNNCIHVGSDYTSSMENDFITFRKNTIIGGDVGLHFQGSPSAGSYKTEGWYIEDNIFMDQYEKGVRLLIGRNSKITGNKFYVDKASAYFIGLDVNQHSDTLLIERNFFNIKTAGIGIMLGYVESGRAHFKQVINNIIKIGTASSVVYRTGISGTRNDSVLVAHNAVYIFSSDNSGYCISSANEDTMLVYNNLLVHEGGGLCYFHTKSNGKGIFATDYNNLYNNKKSVAKLDNVVYDSIPQLVSGRGSDKNSISADPMFMNDSILISYNPKVYEAGKALSSVRYDYFGTVRSSTKPDIGIYEGSVPAVDAGLFSSNLLTHVACPGDSAPFYVTLKNYGSQALTSAEINYSFNNNTFKKSWTGNLSKFQEEDSILLGYISFPGKGSITVKAWTAKPNNQADLLVYNDTLKITSLLAMKGSYSIGDSTADYASLTEAVEDLKTYGVCGPVVLNIDSGLYKEQVSIPAISGASATNTITIQSKKMDSSSVVMEHTAFNSVNVYVIKLDGARYIHIKHLTLHSKGSSDIGALLLEKGSSYNRISNNVFTSVVTTSNSYKTTVFFNGGSQNYNEFSNNRITNGGHQLRMIGLSTGNKIENNIFDGTAGQSITISGVKDIVIRKNSITGGRANSPVALGLNSITGKIFVEQNKIDVSGSGITAIDIKNCYGTKDTALLFANNFITTTSNYYSLGVTIGSVSDIKFLHNSFNAVGASNQVIQISNKLTNTYFYNNIYHGAQGGKSYYSIYKLDTANVHSDYNAFYSADTSNFHHDGTTYSLTGWRSVTGQDKYSVFTDPQYVSASDLHVSNASSLQAAGKPFPEVMADIDDEPRDKLTPDIGADEFGLDSSTYYDIRLLSVLYPDTSSCSQSDSIIIQLVNKSSFPITSFDAEYSLYNQEYPVQKWTANILPRDTFRANLGYFPFAPNTEYAFNLKISNPNGKSDNYFNDNTSSVKYYTFNNVKIFSKPSDDCNENIELYIKKFPWKSVLWSTGSDKEKIIVTSPGTYTVTVTDEKGCKVTDSITIK